jgi:Protein of unknown function (DUF3592)
MLPGMSAIRNTPQAMRIVSRIFVPLGLCFLAFGVWSGFQTQEFLRRSLSATGKVVELTKVHNRDSEGVQESYAPIFQFSDSTGVMYTVTSNTSSNPPAFRMGEIVPVRYDSKNPTEAKIDSPVQLWLFASVFSFVGFSFGLIGVALFVVERRGRL